MQSDASRYSPLSYPHPYAAQENGTKVRVFSPVPARFYLPFSFPFHYNHFLSIVKRHSMLPQEMTPRKNAPVSRGVFENVRAKAEFLSFFDFHLKSAFRALLHVHAKCKRIRAVLIVVNHVTVVAMVGGVIFHPFSVCQLIQNRNTII